MTASLGQRRAVFHLTQAQVLLGSIGAFLLGGYAFASGRFDWASLFRSHPLLSVPCTLSLFAAPALLYISVRQMTEIGVRRRLVVSALLSAVAVGLIAFGLRLWLRNVAGYQSAAANAGSRLQFVEKSLVGGHQQSRVAAL